MRGYVPTPKSLVDQMVDLLFEDCPPQATSRVLDPGCGPGAFISGVIRWCCSHSIPIPSITGIELDPGSAEKARQTFKEFPQVQIRQHDFLTTDIDTTYDYVIANPPYVSILKLDSEEKREYRCNFVSAVGRFDLYMLFMEKALQQCSSNAILVFVTPEKYAYVNSGRGIRQVLARHQVTDFMMIDEGVFSSITAYPVISKILKDSSGKTRFTARGEPTRSIHLPTDGTSWRDSFASHITTLDRYSTKFTLKDFCLRISCGVATGADNLFVFPEENLPAKFRPFAWPTVAGRQLNPTSDPITTTSVMLVPYDNSAHLLNIEKLGALGEYFLSPEISQRLKVRSCAKRKPWYAFHDSPPMKDLTQPKIICKDICKTPFFRIDAKGSVIPRHSVYYIVPSTPSLLKPIGEFLNSSCVKEWIVQNAQRASNGYLRVQSSLLKKLPIPEEIAEQWSRTKQAATLPLPLFPDPTTTLQRRQ